MREIKCPDVDDVTRLVPAAAARCKQTSAAARWAGSGKDADELLGRTDVVDRPTSRVSGRRALPGGRQHVA